MIEKATDGFDPVIFRKYQQIAVRVLRLYEKDKRREEQKLHKAKENLDKRLKFGKSKGLINRWTSESALKSFRQSETNFEIFCLWEKSETYQFYKELASCPVMVHNPTGSGSFSFGKVKGIK